MENKFQPKNYHFENGVKIEIDSKKITMIDKNNHKNISSENLDNFSKQDYVQDMMSPGTLWFRFVAASIVLIGISETIWGGWSFMSWSFTLILIVVNIIFFMFFMIDELIEANILRRFIRAYLSYEGILVTIGNNSGNNIEFLVSPEDNDKVNQLEKAIDELKKYKKDKLQNNKVNQTTSNLDELKKLGDLLANKIITQEEFDIKKKELLK